MRVFDCVWVYECVNVCWMWLNVCEYGSIRVYESMRLSECVCVWFFESDWVCVNVSEWVWVCECVC